MIEYVFIDAWHSRENGHTVVTVDRTWRSPGSTTYHYNPTKKSILRLTNWVKNSGAEVRPWNFEIGWHAALTLEEPE